MRSTSFTPGADSTPPLTSTPAGRRGEARALDVDPYAHPLP
ncbi:MAG: hypothetical protein ACYTGX_06790 [Planctomycetota bacterium]